MAVTQPGGLLISRWDRTQSKQANTTQNMFGMASLERKRRELDRALPGDTEPKRRHDSTGSTGALSCLL